MAEYRVEFEADASRASRTINLLEKAIKEVTKEFKQAEIGSESFLDAGLQISRLTKEVNDAKGAIVNADRAQRQFNQALEAGNKAFGTAIQAAQKYNDGLQKLANESYQKQQDIRDKNFRDEVDDWDRRLKVAVAASSKLAQQQRAIMEFRAGMGARGAIPAVASPIRGGAAFPGSPEYTDILRRNQAAAAAGAGGAQVRPSPQAFDPKSLAAFESKLKTLKNEARLIAPGLDRWKELTREIIKTEGKIKAIQRSQSAGPSMRSRLGAAGGAFLYGGGLGGGAGSALAGVGGGLLGGPAGAFAGAAAGQLIDNLTRGLAAMASQAAAVQQMQRGLAMASVDAKDFAEAQSTVAAISQKLLMPLEQTTRLFSQLRVNTKQYNLSVQDTARIMEGTALAIAATGGSSEDLEGAMRAVVQIFSKGGVQAEELRGQLGERFPGAVVKFAQANKLSFEELQKGLEDGRIGIKEFVAFAEKNYTDYAEFSKQLATAPEFAGRRLQIAMEELTREIGGLFAPIGADIQNVLTAAIKEVSRFIVDNRSFLRQFIADWASIVGPIVKVFGQLLATLARFALEVSKVFQGVFALIRRAAGMATIGEAKARYDEAKAAIAGKTRPTGQGGKRGSAQSVFSQYDVAKREFEALGGNAAFARANAPLTPTNLTFGGAGAGMSMERAAAGDEGGGRKGKGGKGRESRLPELTEELNLAKQLLVVEQQISMTELGGNQLAVIRLNGVKEQLRIQSEIAKVRLQQDVPLAEQQMQIEKLRIDAEKQRLQTNFEIQQKIQSELQNVQNAMTSIATTAAAELEDRKQYERLVAEGLAPALAKITVEVQRQFANEVAKLKTLEVQIQAEIDILTAKQNQTAEDKKQLDILQKRLGLVQGGITDAPELAGEVIQSRTQKQLLEERPKSSAELITEASKNAQNELAKLTNFGYQAVEGAKAIGGAFAQAFKDIASGSMTAQEALANMMQSIASHFLDMAAQIIAQQMTMIILGTIMKALGLTGGGGGGLSSAFGSGGPQFNPAAFSMPQLAAEGAYWQGGFQAFADGGVVNGPTLGLIGEGGEPEYIIPASKMSSAMARYSAGARGNAVIPAEGGEGISSMSIGAPTGAIDVRYSVERINSVDYVTADQFQRGMAQAAQQGAKQGEQMTLRRLQQSRSTRSRLGMN